MLGDFIEAEMTQPGNEMKRYIKYLAAVAIFIIGMQR